MWRDGDSATLIDTGAPGSGDEILAAVPQIDRIVLTHGHVDHCSSAAEQQDAAGATVFAGVGDVLDFGGGAEILANVGTVMLGTLNQDRTQTVAAFQRLAELDVETAFFGHGEPIISAAHPRIRDTAATLTG